MLLETVWVWIACLQSNGRKKERGARGRHARGELYLPSRVSLAPITFQAPATQASLWVSSWPRFFLKEGSLFGNEIITSVTRDSLCWKQHEINLLKVHACTHYIAGQINYRRLKKACFLTSTGDVQVNLMCVSNLTFGVFACFLVPTSTVLVALFTPSTCEQVYLVKN